MQTDEKKLKKEFQIFGPIRSIRIVVDEKTGLSKGYAFIEYENKRDFDCSFYLNSQLYRGLCKG